MFDITNFDDLFYVFMLIVKSLVVVAGLLL